MTGMLAIIAFGFLFAAGMAWKCVELIRKAANEIPEFRDDEYDAPIKYEDFRQ